MDEYVSTKSIYGSSESAKAMWYGSGTLLIKCELSMEHESQSWKMRKSHSLNWDMGVYWLLDRGEASVLVSDVVWLWDSADRIGIRKRMHMLHESQS